LSGALLSETFPACGESSADNRWEYAVEEALSRMRARHFQYARGIARAVVIVEIRA